MSISGCSSTPAGSDAGSEAGNDDTGVRDTGVKDMGVKDSVMEAGSMCPMPGDVSSFMPPSYKPPITPVNVCTAQDVSDYFAKCFTPPYTGCQAFITAHMTCVNCLENDGKDATWGANVDIGPAANPNLAGCVALMGDTPCATAIQEALWCENAACEERCWTNSAMMDPDFTAYLTCLTNAGNTNCKSYNDKANTACNADGGNAYKTCTGLIGTSFQMGYDAMALMFCEGGG
jgi:hypothetical protein